jgi:hypothetical protein
LPLLPLDARTVLYGQPDEIGRLDLETGRTQPFGPAVAAPHSLVLARDGRLRVTDSARRILAVDLASGTSTTASDGLRTPLGMITDAAGAILVLEYGPARSCESAQAARRRRSHPASASRTRSRSGGTETSTWSRQATLAPQRGPSSGSPRRDVFPGCGCTISPRAAAPSKAAASQSVSPP